MFSKKSIGAFLMCVSMVISEPPVPIPQYGVPFNNNGGPPPGSLPVGKNGGPNYYNGNDVGGGPNYYNGNDVGGGPNYYNGNDVGGHGDHDHSQAMAYEFGYQVKDDFSGNNYGRQEKSDGNEVRGEYRVQLPDGRIQIVTYYADWQTGFHADVRYEGQARYPDQYNGNIIPNQYEKPGIDINTGNVQDVVPGNRYGPPGLDINQGGFNEGQGPGRYDNRNYDRGYNNVGGGSGSGTGYTNVNDGINFDTTYNYNRNKPVPVYGPP